MQEKRLRPDCLVSHILTKNVFVGYHYFDALLVKRKDFKSLLAVTSALTSGRLEEFVLTFDVNSNGLEPIINNSQPIIQPGRFRVQTLGYIDFNV